MVLLATRFQRTARPLTLEVLFIRAGFGQSHHNIRGRRRKEEAKA